MFQTGDFEVLQGTWWWAFLFYFGVHRSWLMKAQKRSILYQTWQAFQLVKVVQKGYKGTKKPTFVFFYFFWTLLGPYGPFWTISNKNWFFAAKHLCQTLLCPFGAKNSFLSEMAQKGPDGPQRGPIINERAPFWSLFWSIWVPLPLLNPCYGQYTMLRTSTALLAPI